MVDDRQLIDRVLDGDPSAADMFVTRFTRLVWAILIRQTGIAAGHVEDVYQEVFVRLWEDGYRRIRVVDGADDKHLGVLGMFHRDLPRGLRDV